MEYLDPQQLAITTIDKNIAVNAGAGTGKTKVLTERFVYILEHGNLEEYNEIDSIVAITFTKKATQEMIERIRGEIRKNFHKGDKWRSYYRDLEQANISTIHSFCGKLLRENPIEANIDPLFEVLEDDRSAKLLKNSIVEVLEESLEENDDFLKLMKVFNINRIEKIVDDFYSVYNNIRTVGLDFEDVKSMSMDYLGELQINEDDLIDIKDTIIYLSDKISKNSNLYKMLRDEDPIWVDFYNGSYNDKEIYEIIEYFESKLGKSTKEVEHFERLKKSMANVLKTKDSQNKWLYSLALDLLLAIDHRYNKVKNSLAVLDYDDLQIKVLRLLDNEDIREHYQEKFKYFMIDEFQDTNELQRKIFYKLTTVRENLDKSNLFIVGDPKQSIYGFRGSDIDVFYDTIKDISNITKDRPITMSKNYRTTGTVLNFINTVFSGLMEDEYDPLIPASIVEDRIDIEILENNDYENYPELKDSEKATIYEANLIAKRIKTLVMEGLYDYKDFALLFRATTRNYIYEEALNNYNIPYFNSSSKRYFYRQEILDIINALKTISNPYDNIATIGFLRSPMVGISDNSIYYLLKNRENSLYDTMKKFDSLNISKEDQEKIESALMLLDYFYELKDINTIAQVTEELVEKTYFIETTLLKSNGKQSMANIYKFIELVKSYENINKNSLEDFIDYIDEIKDGNESEATIESEDSNVVKLLTIHKSKGLEFPVVIIPEMCRDSGGRLPNLLFNKDLGLGIKSDSSSGIYDEIKTIISAKEDEEKKRVLYVAMTRAEKMLILGSQGKNSGFKKLIGELLDPDQYKLISSIDLDTENSHNIKPIEESLLNSDEDTGELTIPLLFNTTVKKTFESYSISQYLVFNECKRKYYIDYYHGRTESYGGDTELEINSTNLTAIDKGNIVHKFCQFYDSSMDVDELLKDVTMSFALTYEEGIKKSLMPYIDNYLKVYREDFDKVFSEKPFHIKIGTNYLNGVIDRINIKNDTIEILDIKTNRMRDKKALVRQYTPQLQLYAYAVGKIMKKQVNKASILFLESGDLVEIPIGESELENNMKKISEFIDFVESNNRIENYTKSLNCSQCNYKSICF